MNDFDAMKIVFFKINKQYLRMKDILIHKNTIKMVSKQTVQIFKNMNINYS